MQQNDGGGTAAFGGRDPNILSQLNDNGGGGRRQTNNNRSPGTIMLGQDHNATGFDFNQATTLRSRRGSSTPRRDQQDSAQIISSGQVPGQEPLCRNRMRSRSRDRETNNFRLLLNRRRQQIQGDFSLITIEEQRQVLIGARNYQRQAPRLERVTEELTQIYAA